MLGLQLVAAALAAICALRPNTARPLAASARRLIGCGALLALIGLLQIVPLPGAARLGLLPAASALGQLPAGNPAVVAPGLHLVSVSPPETTVALLQLVAYLLVGGVALVAFRSADERDLLGLAIVGSAGLQALYGLAEYLTGSQRIFLYERLHYLDCATGTFINRNHYAAFLAGSMPFVLVFAMRGWDTEVARLRRGRMLALRIGLGALLGLLSLAILLSRSRAGLVSAIIASAVVFLSGKRVWARALAFGAVVVVATLLLLTIEVVPPAVRFFSLESDLAAQSTRPVLWRTTLEGALSFPILGVGLGTFVDWFPGVQPPGFPGMARHAHSDWLQLAAEGGWIAVVLVAALIVIAWRAWREGRRGLSRAGSNLTDAAFASICAIAAHSAVDFPMRIPAVALLAVVSVGLAVDSSEDDAPLAQRPGA